VAKHQMPFLFLIPKFVIVDLEFSLIEKFCLSFVELEKKVNKACLIKKKRKEKKKKKLNVLDYLEDCSFSCLDHIL